MSNYDFNNYQQDALTKPRDKAWDNWAEFKTVGDSVQGYIRDVFFRPAEGVYRDQRGITLEQVDGVLINVGIKYIDFVLVKTDELRLGDPLTIVLEKELPAKEKGLSPTKQFGFYGKNLPENLGNKTVKQLELEDKGIVEAAAKKADDEFNGEPATAGVETPADAADVPFPSPSDTPVAAVATDAGVANQAGTATPETTA